MRRPNLAFLLALAATPSCTASVQPRDLDRSALSASPATSEWKSGSVWSFSTTPKRGKVETFTFRVTDQAARPCAEGGWKKLEPLSGPVDASDKPAYLLRGSLLTIRLTSNFCHVGMFEGELSGKVFRGNRDSTDRDEFEGLVDGRRVEQ